MHSTEDLAATDFRFRVNGRDGALEDVFPGFSAEDRLGVVVAGPCGGTGASLLTLACVTAFYEAARRRLGDAFHLYPDFFFLHVGSRLGDHQELEIWPDHKEPVVDGGPEALLRAVNDRGVTRLLVPEMPAGPPPPDVAFSREALASARWRIRNACAYSHTGEAAGADIVLVGPAVVARYVEDVFRRHAATDPAGAASARAARRAIAEEGAVVESYRRLNLDEALACMTAVAGGRTFGAGPVHRSSGSDDEADSRHRDEVPGDDGPGVPPHPTRPAGPEGATDH